MKPLLIGTIGPDNRIWWKILNARTGATLRQYLDAFDRHNLPRDVHAARAKALDILNDIRSSKRTVVLLGSPARAAFDFALGGDQLPPILIHPTIAGGCIWRQIPDALCSWYDVAENRRLVEMLLEELYVRHRRRSLDVAE